MFPEMRVPQCLHFALTAPDDSEGISKFLSTEAAISHVSLFYKESGLETVNQFFTPHF